MIVFAERTPPLRIDQLFRLGYVGYRIMHYALTGRGIRFGNFSIIPRARLTGLTVEPMLWNHYAASVIASRVPIATIPTDRDKRIAGKSHLSFVKLVIHGLSALSCYSETIGVRLLLVASILFAVSLVGIIVTMILRMATDPAVAGLDLALRGHPDHLSSSGHHARQHVHDADHQLTHCPVVPARARCIPGGTSIASTHA